MNVNGEQKEEKKEVQTKQKHGDNISTMIEKLKPQLAKALPKHVTTERLARVALTAIRNNPKLGQADALSLMGSIMTGAQLGLEPNTPLGECYIIPYKDNKTGVINAQFQIGYKGILKLAHQTREYRQITAHTVDEADQFKYEYGLEPKLNHVPADKPTGKVIYYYAVYHLVNGGFDFKVWSKDKVMEHAIQHSQSWDKSKKEFRYGSAWASNFDSMACKTVIIDLLKYAPKSVEIAQAVAADNRTYRIDPDDPELNIDAIDGDFEVPEE